MGWDFSGQGWCPLCMFSLLSLASRNSLQSDLIAAFVCSACSNQRADEWCSSRRWPKSLHWDMDSSSRYLYLCYRQTSKFGRRAYMAAFFLCACSHNKDDTGCLEILLLEITEYWNTNSSPQCSSVFLAKIKIVRPSFHVVLCSLWSPKVGYQWCNSSFCSHLLKRRQRSEMFGDLPAQDLQCWNTDSLPWYHQVFLAKPGID